MKNIRLIIDKKYTDGRKYDKFFDEGPLDAHGSYFATKELSVGLGFKHIDFQTGDIEIETGEILHSGEPYIEDKGFLVTTLTYFVEDDGVPCNEDTLYVLIECSNSETNKKDKEELLYRKGETITMASHPYQVTILDTNNEEITVEIKDKDKTTTHLVQLYNPIERNDEHYYATGNPNDPVDTCGPLIYVRLLRK